MGQPGLYGSESQYTDYILSVQLIPCNIVRFLNLGTIYYHLKSSLRNLRKVTQSPIVPRVRGGDPSGVAPGKVEGFFSAPGHPWKLFS